MSPVQSSSASSSKSLKAPVSPCPSSTTTTMDCINDDTVHNNQCSPDNSSGTSIYYFGYGPIVNPIVRRRRGVKTVGNGRAAILKDHKLTWAFGGVVNIVKQRGFEVMGVLIEFSKQDDWSQFQQFDAGYDLDEVIVYPLTPPSSQTVGPTVINNHPDSDGEGGDEGDDDNEGLLTHTNEAVKAYTFVMKDFDESKLFTSTIEKLPSERYLKLIASGMRTYGIDEDYINDQIMSVPYVPQRKPEDYRTFPPTATQAVTTTRTKKARTTRSSDTCSRSGLPRITFARYKSHLCSHKYRKTSPDDVFFILQHRVITVERPFDPTNPSIVWLRGNVMGLSAKECTLRIHQTVVDPDVPMVDTPEQITLQHERWAENHIVEWMEQGGLRGRAIFEIKDDNVNIDHSKDGHRRGGNALLGRVLKWICPCKDALSAVTDSPPRKPTTHISTGLAAGSRHSSCHSNSAHFVMLTPSTDSSGNNVAHACDGAAGSLDGDSSGDINDYDHDGDAPTSMELMHAVHGHTNDDDTVEESSTHFDHEHECTI